MALVQFCDYRGKTKADMKSHSRVHFKEVDKQIGKRRGKAEGTEEIYNRSLSPVPSLAAISPVELPSHWLAIRCDH